MTSIAEQIRSLREQTGAGMVDCKNALSESGGDMEKAVEILRKKGMAQAAKKAGRIAAEGLLGFAANADGTAAALVEVNCETDFVAKNSEFAAFCDDVARLAATHAISDVSALAGAPLGAGATVETRVQELVAKIGEKISVRRAIVVKAGAGEALVPYMHPGNKIGVLVRAGGKGTAEEKSFLKDVAMHIAAMSPQYLKAEEIPTERLAKEKEIFAAQLAEEKKPAAILDKILEGKLSKFKKDVSLVDQIFVKDPDGRLSVGAWQKTHFPALELRQFVRFQVGEGIEKKAENFAEEVARQVAASSK